MALLTKFYLFYFLFNLIKLRYDMCIGCSLMIHISNVLNIGNFGFHIRKCIIKQIVPCRGNNSKPIIGKKLKFIFRTVIGSDKIISFFGNLQLSILYGSYISSDFDRILPTSSSLQMMPNGISIPFCKKSNLLF